MLCFLFFSFHLLLLVVCSASYTRSTFLLRSFCDQKKITSSRNFFRNLNFKNIVNFFNRTCCVLIWLKKTLILFNLQRVATGNEFSNIKYTFAESLRLQMSVFYTKVCGSSRLVSQVYMIDGQNINKTYLMHEILISMLKQRAILNSNVHNVKFYSSKGYRNTSQRWIICTCELTQQF